MDESYTKHVNRGADNGEKAFIDSSAQHVEPQHPKGLEVCMIRLPDYLMAKS